MLACVVRVRVGCEDESDFERLSWLHVTVSDTLKACVWLVVYLPTGDDKGAAGNLHGKVFLRRYGVSDSVYEYLLKPILVTRNGTAWP